MKEIFGWYYRPTQEEFKALWAEGTFVFDTNVLLTLYRYPARLREVFFLVMEKISDRVWIPYQVGLEFHRNKFVRIREENKKVNEILSDINDYGERIIANANKLTLNNINAGLRPEDMQEQIEAFRVAHKAICDVASKARENLPENDLNDQIGLRIVDLFKGKVGAPPENQSELDSMLSDAESRFDSKIPPGYKDRQPKDESSFYDGPILYKNKYGDLILWRQTIAYAKQGQKRKLVFVTDDSKPDWWDTDGHLTRGPLPALLREMHVEGEVDIFWIYKSDQFLKFAEEYLQAHEVTEEDVEQAKGISEKSVSESQENRGEEAINFPPYAVSSLGQAGVPSALTGEDVPAFHRDSSASMMSEVRFLGMVAERAVEVWLNAQFPGEVYRNWEFPDFIVSTGFGSVGYEVKYFKEINGRFSWRRIHEAALRGSKYVHNSAILELVIVVVASEHDAYGLSSATLTSIRRITDEYPYVSVAVGFVRNESFKEVLFMMGKSASIIK